MRVPLYPEDLLPHDGFKRIAKWIRRNWPGAANISLNQSYELLAKGFGYRDFHDARKSAKALTHAAQLPTHAEVLTGVERFFGSAQSHGQAANDLNSRPLSELLPLHALKAFRESTPAKYNQEGSPLVPPPPQDSTVPESRVLKLCSTKRQGGIPLQAEKVDIREPVKPEELLAITKYLIESGDQRNLAIFNLLLSGLRVGEITDCRVSDGSVILHKSKTRRPFQRIKVPDDLVDKYVQISGMKDGDCLFPSRIDLKVAMTDIALRKLIVKWGWEAGLGRDVTADALRRFSAHHDD